MSLAIDLLGPLRLTCGGHPVGVTAGRLRVLLAVLALSPGRPVPLDRLAAALWGETLPDNPRRSLHTYVTRLRSALGGPSIGTRPNGYLLDVPPEAVDVMRFGRLLDEADRAYHAERKRALLAEALLLWRGEPFEDLGSPWLMAVEAPALIERYLAALEGRVDLDLAAGRHDGLAAELREMTERHPLRESLWARLLVVLARGGRSAEALAGYGTIRALLAEELGTNPGAELRRIHADLLAGATLTGDRSTPSLATPRQLPAAPPTFTGREAEVADLERVRDPATVTVTAVDGMAGTGKTALAVHVGHRTADRYPDGQLFIDLHGHTPGVSPVEPGRALDVMLRALGVPGARIPMDSDERAALFRSVVAGRRILVVLDNAAGEWQVQPLLPGLAGCHVLITSRCRLTGLDHVRNVSLPVLSPGDAVTLFRRTVGEPRLATATSRDVLDIVRLCGQLPLAIRIVAARLRAHPVWTATDLAERLGDHDHRLAELALGHRSVSAALDVSYRHLPDDQRRIYRLLGLHPGADFDADAVAALAAVPVATARQLMDDLLDVHLVQEPVVRRFRFHDLVRVHAAAAAGEESAAERRAAVGRLLDHYAQRATAAVGIAYPYEWTACAPLDSASCGFATTDAAVAWLDATMPTLLATVRHAADQGIPAHILLLARVLARHLLIRCWYVEAETLHHLALATARASGDRPAELRALLGIGALCRRQDHDRQAIDVFNEALDLARAAGEHIAEMEALTFLGHMDRRLRRLDSAADHYGRALGLATRIEHRTGQAYALSGLGRVQLLQHRWREAVDSFTAADQLSRSIGDRVDGLGPAAGLGDGYRLLGQPDRAAFHYHRALTAADQAGDRNWQMEILHGLGLLYRTTGHPRRAIEHHRQALRIASELGQRADQARAHDGLAKVHHGLGQEANARRHWRHALDILSGIGATSTEDGEVSVATIEAHLAGRAG